MLALLLNSMGKAISGHETPHNVAITQTGDKTQLGNMVTGQLEHVFALHGIRCGEL